MIDLNYRDARPIYKQIEEGYKRLMFTGAMPPGDRMPSVRELATQLAINPNTIQRAYRELEAAGYIYTVTGKGTFVADVEEMTENRRRELLDSFDAAARELTELGYTREELAARLGKENRQ